MSGSVSPERTGWRDEWISRKHREWGVCLPAVDVDFLLVEYLVSGARSFPCGFVDYKKLPGAEYGANKGSPNNDAVIWIADKCDLPFFIVKYYHNEDSSAFEVCPMNEIASEVLLKFDCHESPVSERDYVRLLNRLRLNQLGKLGKSIKSDDVKRLVSEYKDLEDKLSHKLHPAGAWT